MTDTSLVPSGIKHDPNLSALPPAERMKHHQRQLRSIALHQGIEGVTAYKASHPEAAALRIHSAPVAYAPKPSGYSAAVVDMVALWFDNPSALAQSNRADVEALNARLGSGFNPGNHFSKPLSKPALRKLGEMFAARGAHLDLRQCNTLSKVRRAVKAASIQGAAAVPVGTWGRREGDKLHVAGHTFAIECHNGKDCIRLSVSGTRIRLRLDALTEFLSLAGMTTPENAGVSSHHLPRRGMGELAPDSETAGYRDSLADNLPETWPLPNDTEPILHGDLAPSLAERIRSLPTRLPDTEHVSPFAGDTDPLALI